MAVHPFCADTSMEAMLASVDELSEKALHLQQGTSQDGHPVLTPDVKYPFSEDVAAALRADDVAQLGMVLEKIKYPSPGTVLNDDEVGRVFSVYLPLPLVPTVGL